jgi:hypothetical protein
VTQNDSSNPHELPVRTGIGLGTPSSQLRGPACLPQHSPLLAAAVALHVAGQELDVAGSASIAIY